VEIIEEPFSVWRLLRSWFRRPVSVNQADAPRDVAANDQQTEPPRGDPTTQDPSRSDAPPEADDAESLEVANLGDPSVLAGLNFSVTNYGRATDGALWVEHLLICNACIAGDMFSIVSFPTVAPDPSPYPGVAPGETAHLPPWSVRCIECGAETIIFDPRTAGYGRVLNGASGDARGDDEPTEETGAASVFLSLIYRSALDELTDPAAKANVPPADLFDAVHLRGASPHGETIFEEWRPCS